MFPKFCDNRDFMVSQEIHPTASQSSFTKFFLTNSPILQITHHFLSPQIIPFLFLTASYVIEDCYYVFPQFPLFYSLNNPPSFLVGHILQTTGHSCCFLLDSLQQDQKWRESSSIQKWVWTVQPSSYWVQWKDFSPGFTDCTVNTTYHLPFFRNSLM